jgi:tRNA nucleotidyltransferase/poly(A) polymerase
MATGDYGREQAAARLARADWLGRPSTQAIFAALNREGFEARAVGGAMRNTLLDLEVSEVDFATTAPPDEIIRLASEAGLKAVPTGIAHGTITLIAHGAPHEVTALRRDVETDGRHARVAFGADWTEDAKRRDFTMNALYADASGALHDPLGGLPDLQAKRVRFIGEADERIAEDYLRILRFFRFSAQHGDGRLDARGLEACVRARRGLLRLSRERVRAEFLKLLVARQAEPVLVQMREGGFLALLLGGVTIEPRFSRLAALEAELGRKPDAILRLGALAVMVREDAERLAERLRLSNDEAAELLALSDLQDFAKELAARGLAALLYRDGSRSVANLLLLLRADRDGEPAPSWAEDYTAAMVWASPVFPVTGHDLMALGLKPGPELGRALKRLEDIWIERRFAPTREDLLALLAEPET